MFKKLNYINLVILILLIVASIFIQGNKDLIFKKIKLVLDSPTFFLIITCISFPITVFYKIKFNLLKLKTIRDSAKLKESVTEILSTITEPSIFVCSISILKGLILDSFYGGNYFPKFNSPEKVFLCIAAFYFFIVTSNELKNYLAELLIKTTTTKQAE